jgi:hypothetical protein
MPKAWTAKDERMYEHVLDSEREQGKPEKRAKSIAAATVNQQRGKEGRTLAQQEARRTHQKMPENREEADALRATARRRKAKASS